MKKFIKDYLKIIASAIIGMIFVLTSFYLVMNYYHSEEIKGQIYVGENDPKLVTYKKTLNEIKTNLSQFQTQKNKNQNYQTMYNHLSTCYTAMTKQGLYFATETNRYYGPNDVYKLGSKFQSDVLNVCWALHLSSIKDNDEVTKFKTVAPFISSEIDSITKKTNNVMDELLNNSSYFYTTSITSATVRNYLTSDYAMITDSYQDFANIILYLSEMINEEVNNG